MRELKPGDQLIAVKGPEAGTPADGPYLNELCEYDGFDRSSRAHLVSTTCRATHQIGGPTLGHEVQFVLTEEELCDLFEFANDDPSWLERIGWIRFPS